MYFKSCLRYLLAEFSDSLHSELLQVFLTTLSWASSIQCSPLCRGCSPPAAAFQTTFLTPSHDATSPAQKLLRNFPLTKTGHRKRIFRTPRTGWHNHSSAKCMCPSVDMVMLLHGEVMQPAMFQISTSCNFLHILQITRGSQELGKLSTQPLVWCNLSDHSPNGIKGNSYRKSEIKDDVGLIAF